MKYSILAGMQTLQGPSCALLFDHQIIKTIDPKKWAFPHFSCREKERAEAWCQLVSTERFHTQLVEPPCRRDWSFNDDESTVAGSHFNVDCLAMHPFI